MTYSRMFSASVQVIVCRPAVVPELFFINKSVSLNVIVSKIIL